MLRDIHFCYYRFNVQIQGISSLRTLSKLYLEIKVTVGGFMFGPLLHITLIRKPLKIRYLIMTVVMEYRSFLCELTMLLRLRQVINPFPDLPKQSFGSEDVIFMLSRQISKVMYFSPFLVSMCVLKLQQTQVSMFKGLKSPCLNSLSQNFF